MAYDLKQLHAPRLSGMLFRIFTRVLETNIPGKWIAHKLMSDTRLLEFRKQEFHAVPKTMPLVPANKPANQLYATDKLSAFIKSTQNQKELGHHFASIRDYQNQYAKQTTNPLELAQKLIASIKDSNSAENDLRAIVAFHEDEILSMAKASQKRWAMNKPLGPLDGIPVSIKDELDLRGYHTTVGTSFLGKQKATQDATVVERLRNAGALLFGKANMHEIGIGVTGYNAHHGICKNPYHLDHYSGGSSSGSGSSVGAGLCPISIGADGGGSIRIPAGFCGVYGLKATFGRLSEHGAAPLCWSVAHVGPLAANPVDLSVAYALMAGSDPKDKHTLVAPEVELPHPAKSSMQGIRIGIYDDFFNDADPEIVQSNKQMLQHFTKAGAKLVKISIPDLECIRVAHVFTIASEMLANFETSYKVHRKDFGRDVRLNLAITRYFTSTDYVRAQQVRAKAMQDLSEIFEKVDCIATPNTAITAPYIRPDVAKAGESDLPTLTSIMRFMVLANLTGNPAIAMPCGYDKKGLPISMQLIANHWNEALLLEIAHINHGFLERQKPALHYDLLNS